MVNRSPYHLRTSFFKACLSSENDTSTAERPSRASMIHLYPDSGRSVGTLPQKSKTTGASEDEKHRWKLWDFLCFSWIYFHGMLFIYLFKYSANRKSLLWSSALYPGVAFRFASTSREVGYSLMNLILFDNTGNSGDWNTKLKEFGDTWDTNSFIINLTCN